MSLKQKLENDLRSSLKSGAKQRLACLRMLKSKIQEQEVALRATKGRDHELSDEEATKVVAAYAKQRRDSIASYREADRPDLAEREEAELAIVAEYLPEPLSEERLREIVAAAITDSGAASPKDMGKVMKHVMPQVQGKADGKLVGSIVRQMLAADSG